MTGCRNLTHLPWPGERVPFKELWGGYIFRTDDGGYYMKTDAHWHNTSGPYTYNENVICFTLSGLGQFHRGDTVIVTVVGHVLNHRLTRLFDQYIETGGNMETEFNKPDNLNTEGTESTEEKVDEFEAEQWAILKEDRDSNGAFEIDRMSPNFLFTKKSMESKVDWFATDLCRHATPLEIEKAVNLNTEGTENTEGKVGEFEIDQWAILKYDTDNFGAFKIGSIRGEWLDASDMGDGLFDTFMSSACRHATPSEIDTAKEKKAAERLERARAENAVDKPDNFNTEKEDDRPSDREIDKMVREITNLRDYQRHAVAEMKKLRTSLGPYEIEMERLRTEREELNHALIKSELKVRGLSAEPEGVKNKTSTMGRWNYRVVKRDCKATRDGKAVFDYGIYETHCDNDGQPNGMTVEPNRPEEESIEALRATMEMMTTALDKPVLNYDEIGEE